MLHLVFYAWLGTTLVLAALLVVLIAVQSVVARVTDALRRAPRPSALVEVAPPSRTRAA